MLNDTIWKKKCNCPITSDGWGHIVDAKWNTLNKAYTKTIDGLVGGEYGRCKIKQFETKEVCTILMCTVSDI